VPHRFFVRPEQIDGQDVTFSPPQVHQLRSVLRLRSDDVIYVFDGLTPVDRVVRLTGQQTGTIIGRHEQAAEPRTRLTVYPALLQRDKFEQVLQKLTEIGVAAIVPTLTERSLVRMAPDERRYERWLSIIREAAEQSGRGRLPMLEPGALTLAEALDRTDTADLALLAYEREQRLTLRAALTTPSRPQLVHLFVGPEGGYTEAEAAQARASGTRPVSLGPRILRTETASPVLAALVLYELGDLSSGYVSDHV
jgi:16S rRNA (uracil1498-N3)-methyltransferase